MSLLHWFSPKKKHEPPPSEMASSGLSRLESTKPYNALRQVQQGATAQPANRKQERMARRELLYAVVREAMVRAGVLSSSYKFKVLSLDPRGRQFLVMVDLAHGTGADTARLAEIEAMVAQSAKNRYDILVSAVYWRANEHVAIGDPTQAAQHAQARGLGRAPQPAPSQANPRASAPAPLRVDARASGAAPVHLDPRRAASAPVPFDAAPSEPAPLDGPVSRPVELRAAPPEGSPRFEPLQADEVAAFRQALAAGVRGEQALAAVDNGKGAHSYTLLTGFEDTELAEGEGEADGDVGEHLSGTQYGALR